MEFEAEEMRVDENLKVCEELEDEEEVEIGGNKPNFVLKLRPPALFLFSRQIAYGLHALLRVNAANIHHKEHWTILFTLLEAVGAASYPDDGAEHHMHNKPIISTRNAQSDVELEGQRVIETISDRGYTSDDPTGYRFHTSSFSMSERAGSTRTSNEWIHLDTKETSPTEPAPTTESSVPFPRSRVFDRGTIVLNANISRHDPAAFLKVSEIIYFLARDAAHITPENFESCVKCIRSMVEATKSKRPELSISGKGSETGEHELSEAEQKQKQLSEYYNRVASQLIDLCSTLYAKAPSIYREWAENNPEIDSSCTALWHICWRPLLQAIARIGCDCRRQVRHQALHTLERAFLIPELNEISEKEWENCFAEVLLPLLAKLLENISPMDPLGLEETRVRAMRLVSKIMLNHLTPLSSLSNFAELFARILDLMKRYLQTERKTDLLPEAIPECLKNMILVMDNSGLFASIPGLHQTTTTCLATFLPSLIQEVMPLQTTLPTESAHQPDAVKSSSIDYVQIGKPLDIDAIKNLNIKPDETTQTSVGETSNISNQVPPTEPKIEHVDLTEIVVHSSLANITQVAYNVSHPISTSANQGTQEPCSPTHLSYTQTSVYTSTQQNALSTSQSSADSFTIIPNAYETPSNYMQHSLPPSYNAPTFANPTYYPTIPQQQAPSEAPPSQNTITQQGHTYSYQYPPIPNVYAPPQQYPLPHPTFVENPLLVSSNLNSIPAVHAQTILASSPPLMNQHPIRHSATSAFAPIVSSQQYAPTGGAVPTTLPPNNGNQASHFPAPDQHSSLFYPRS
uniref:GBF1-like tetratricopeptide repeats domain-containing protein n=1 Tax=Acrobeloides nanus TaxID=290746 RepID=A0A914BZ81_9BILA